jgi:dihydropteroate synthase
MGVRAAGVLRLGGRRFEPWQLLVMAVAPGPSMEWVHAAVGEGADIVELPAPLVAPVRDAYPELIIGVRTGSGEVAREAGAAGADLLAGPMVGVAAELGVGVVGSLAGAGRAVEAGVAAERVMVTSGGPVADLVASGWPVLVSLPDSDLARAAVFAWQGARVFRVERVRETRRALRMVSAIRGDIPPAHAVRGLA